MAFRRMWEISHPKHLTISQRRIIFLLFIQRFILGLGGSIIAPLIPIISDDFKVKLDIFGLALSLGSFGLLATSLLSVILSERFRKKNILILGNILSVISFLSLYFSSNFKYFTFSYIILNISFAIITINSVSIISDISKPIKSKNIIRLSLVAVLGAFLGPIIVSSILFLNVSWRYLFLPFALINVILLIFTISIKIEGLDNKKNRENFISLFIFNRKLLSNLIIILCGVIAFLHYGFGHAFLQWFTTYFKTLNVPVSISSLISSLYILILGSGLFVQSFLLTKFSKKKLMQFSSILAFIFLFTSMNLDWLVLKVIFILLSVFSFSTISLLSLSIGINQNPQYSGIIISILNSYGFIGVIIFQYVTGYMLENYSGESIIYISLFSLFLLIIFTSLLRFYYKFDRKVS